MSAGLDAALISATFQDLTIDRVLALVARRLETELVVQGKVFYLGTRRPEDRAVMVRRVLRLDQEQIQNVVEGFSGTSGASTVTTDGVLIVGDKIEVLDRLHEVFDRLEKAPSVLWCIQLHVVSMTSRDLADFGLDIEPALELAAGYAELSNVTRALVSGAIAGARSEGPQSVVDVSLSAILRAARERGTVRIIADPVLTVCDGDSANVVKGASVPVREVVTNGQTGNTQSSVRFVQTGLDITAGVREVSDSLARLKLDLSISEILGSQQDAPITDKQSLRSSLDVRTGGVYLVGSLRRGKGERALSGALSFGASRNVEDDVWLVFVKTYRVASALDVQ